MRILGHVRVGKFGLWLLSEKIERRARRLAGISQAASIVIGVGGVCPQCVLEGVVSPREKNEDV